MSASDDDDGERKECLNCGASFEGLKRCGKCKAAYFCNAACQREVWRAHCKVCVAPEGTAAPPPRAPPPPDADAGAAGAAGQADARAGQPPQASAAANSAAPQPQQQQEMTPEEREAEQKRVKQEELRRINQEVLPEVDRLMRAGEFEDAIEHLEDGVAFASGYDERELLDSLSCLLARAFLGQKKPKEALMGLNPALMQARREGGPRAVKPHSIAAEAHKMQGDTEKMRVELRALMEAAAESTDVVEQGAALLLAGCLLHDVGDLQAAVPLLSSAAAAGEKLGDFAMSAGARNRAGAALLRLRRPQQALEAWADELKVLEEWEKAAAKAAEKEVDVDNQAEEEAARTKVLELRGGAGGKGEGAGEGGAAAGAGGAADGAGAGYGAASSADVPGSPSSSPAAADMKTNMNGDLDISGENPKEAAAAAAGAALQLKLKSVGQTRERQCQAHGNIFMALLLMGSEGPGPGRPAAEQHLQHALSLARRLSPAEVAEEQEARVWVQAGNAHRLASAGGAQDGGGEEAQRAYAKALELAKKVGADDLVAAAERGLANNLDVATMLK